MNKNLIWIGSGVIALGLIVLMAMEISGEEPIDSSIGFRDVTVTGEALPALRDPGAGDPGAGMVAPTVVGTDWNNNPVTIEPDGRPKLVVFLAHWCPHCQAEVPVIQNWVNNGGVPDGVDLYAATIFTNASRIEFPPQEWLERENWTVPTVMDNQAGDIVRGYGVVGTPTYIVLDGENRNLGRLSGEIGLAGLNALAAIAEAAG
jgi:cytochrome c biogenesis protein CcmG, thiol:disulfide interchange protein DsbE